MALRTEMAVKNRCPWAKTELYVAYHDHDAGSSPSTPRRNARHCWRIRAAANAEKTVAYTSHGIFLS